ncbi:MAG: HTH domain-containing protein [Pseudobutyrivibrio sp.]|uniref:helix-turn-helix domain-containing protein n=1 Tax=Pseudobutyrivibrio sp. TaxID=2014367 RepID=UPI003B197C9A|nr:HTH domain-containing protein [Pseudobutyrivibrio sp.]
MKTDSLHDKCNYPFFGIYKYESGNINITNFANLLNCSRTTIYKYISFERKR